MPLSDARGLATSSDNAASIAAYEAALSQLQRYRGDPVATIDAALEQDPGFVQGHILRAEVHVTLWEKARASRGCSASR